MAVNNNIVRNSPQTAAAVSEYVANGETVRISPNMVKKYLVSGNGNVTDEEVNMFMSLCRFQHLNPYIRDAYLIKYGDSPATVVVGKDVFMKRAKKQPEFNGFQAGIIVYNENNQLEEREGTFYRKQSEEIVGGWAKVYLKNCLVPFYTSVSMEEYMGRKKNGEPNNQWATKPATMIRKVALAQALREAFPEQNSGGMYVQEELPEAQVIELDDNSVVAEEMYKEAEPKEKAAEPERTKQENASQGNGKDVAAALFGEGE